MAKPIRATPKLTAIETNRFIENMIKMDHSKPSAADKKAIKEVSYFL